MTRLRPTRQSAIAIRVVDERLTQHMVDKPEAPQPLTLKRWSQRKRDTARKAADVGAATSIAPVVVPVAASAAGDAVPSAVTEPVPLPPVGSLDFESDYSAFMQPKVSEETKRAALKKLFSDPSFNVMDGLDIYVGDYTQPDPMPAGMLEKISAVYAILDPTAPPPDATAPDSKLPAVVPAVAIDTTPEPTPAASTEIAAESPLAPDTSASGVEKPA